MYLKNMSTPVADSVLQEAIYQRMSLAISRVAELIDESCMSNPAYKQLQTQVNSIETNTIRGISRWESAWIEGLNQIKRKGL